MSNDKNRKKILLVAVEESGVCFDHSIMKDDCDIMYTKSGPEALDHVIKGFVPNQIYYNASRIGISEREARNRLKGIGLLKDIPVVALPA